MNGPKSVRIRGDTAYGDQGQSLAIGVGSTPDPDLAVGSPGYVVQQFNDGGGFAALRSGLSLSAGELRWRTATDSGGGSMRGMVQVGGVWYVSAQENVVAGQSNFTEYALAYTTEASAWRLLTGTVGSSGLGIGAAPAEDLSGSITGIGLYQTFPGSTMYLDRMEWIDSAAPVDGFTAWTRQRSWPEAGDDGADADPDGDGLSNRMEYFHGSDPLVADRVGIPEALSGGAGLRIRFRARVDDPDVEIRVWRSDTLEDWDSSAAVPVLVEEDPLGDGTYSDFEVVIEPSPGHVKVFGTVGPSDVYLP